MPHAVHQFVAGFTNGDAISNEALVLRAVFRRWGYASDIFSEQRRILPELRHEALDVAAAAGACGPDDTVLLHLSIGSPVNEVFRSLPCRKAILYHNVTPSHYFEFVNRRTAYDLARGRDQIVALAGAAAVNLADSRYNAGELESAGYRNVKVLPLVLDLSRLRTPPDRRARRRFDDGLTNILFVGRCAPNKKIEDALCAFLFYQRTVEKESRFIHVGSYAGTERYYHMLLALSQELRLTSVFFAGCVRQNELNGYYQSARVFLSLSEHEGFCIPLIESMVHDVPIVAYGAAAVPETLDGAGILFREKKYEYVAEMIGQVAHDGPFRSAVLRGQRERLARYENRNLEAELREHLQPVLSPP
jgi:glycosyltransferase involved in cell wall biosynthesis